MHLLLFPYKASDTERLERNHHDLLTSTAKRYQNGGLIRYEQDTWHTLPSQSAISHTDHRLFLEDRSWSATFPSSADSSTP